MLIAFQIHKWSDKSLNALKMVGILEDKIHSLLQRNKIEVKLSNSNQTRECSPADCIPSNKKAVSVKRPITLDFDKNSVIDNTDAIALLPACATSQQIAAAGLIV